MARGIERQVAENRQDVTRLDGQFVSVPDRVQQNLRFLRNRIQVDVSLEVYTRPLNQGLVSGHPDGSTHGSGHGVAGDVRGGWTQVASAASTHEWTRDGRNAVRDALDGQQTGAIGGTAVGTGSADAAPSDAALVAETGSAFAYGVKDSANEVRARSHYLFDQAGDGSPDPQEFGLESIGGTLMGRLTTSSTVSLGPEEELRVDLTVTISGSGSGNSAITNSGRGTVADSIQTEGTVAGLSEIAWGTGSPTIDPSTTSLANQVFKKDAQRTLDLEVIRVSAPQFEFEPAGQPYDYTEVGVLDGNGDLFWVVDFSGDPYPKDSNTRFTTQAGFRIV